MSEGNNNKDRNITNDEFGKHDFSISTYTIGRGYYKFFLKNKFLLKKYLMINDTIDRKLLYLNYLYTI